MKKTLAIMLALIMVLALVPTVAFAAEPKTIYVDATNGNDTTGDGTGTKPYKTVEAAAKAAASGDTIQLGEGNYTLYGVSSEKTTKTKDLTFVGQGVEKTTWIIGAEVPDPNKSGTEYNSDYSFSGASVTFKDMTLNSYYSKEDKNKSGYENYLGFAHTVNTLVDSCVINGVTAYWGYTSAAFRNTTFNAPVGGYALWSYSSAIMTFDNCTFNSSGKVINVYNEGYTPNVTVNFNNCTVKNTDTSKKAVLNINDRYVSGFTINISGKNSVDGITADNMTCSCLFGFGGKEKNPENVNGTLYYSNNNKTVVTINGVKVWENGKRVCPHNGFVFGEGSYNGDKTTQYTDGYKDNAFTVEPNGPGSFEVTCDYCGYTETSTGKLYNDIGLTRTVRQNKNSNPVPEDAANSNKYKVANSSNITVDYTATMNMENLRWLVAGKDIEEIQKKLEVSEVKSPWELLMAQPDWITEDTVVFLKFTFDKNIDLEAFKATYEAAVNAGKPTDVLMLESNMFEIADGGVQFDIENQIENPKREMTIKCNWNWKKEAGLKPDPKITLYGYGLPVKDNWGGSKIDITNSGCVKGMVHINPMGGAVAAMVEPGSNVAENVQVQNTYPPVDNTIKIPIVGGCKTDEFTLYYGGGSSGDSSDGSSSGGGYYYPTTTPVPVIVIPPKTGDMTVWQSILHFLGIR